MPDPTLPTGTVTFLFTDIEGSTRLLRDLGALSRATIERHDEILASAIAEAGGVVVRTEGDSFFAVFESAAAAVRAAMEAQRALSAEPWPGGSLLRVRMGVHTGDGVVGTNDYIGLDVHRASRIADGGHGGQVLVSAATRALVGSSLPEGAALRSLGSHLLKDFDEPQELYQLDVEGLPSDFPSLRTRQAAVKLPSYRTSFVGRERERADLVALLEPGAVVTVLGTGGTGKTRLAVEVARDAAVAFPDGVHFVDLSAVLEPALVPSTVAAVVGVAEASGRPTWEVLAEHVRDRRMLLVLDNFEQVMDAAASVQELCASEASALVTSRAPLRISGEQRYPLDGLVEEAVGLFIDRARAVDPSFDPSDQERSEIAEICARLDGLPLAIELAASRIATMPVAMLKQRLQDRLGVLTEGARDLPERQRTLRDAIAWSHDLLDDREQMVFRRLGVFSGGWSLDAVAPVVDRGGELGIDPVEAVASLVEKNLVRRGPGSSPRYRMLETIREFAAERLEAEDDPDEVRSGHALFFVALAEDTAPKLTGPDQASWLDLLEDEHDNCRAVLRWSLATDRIEPGLRLGAALWRFWQLRGRLSEGRDWLERLLACPAAWEPTAVRGRALSALGSLAYWQGDIPAVRRAYEEARDVFEEIGDEREIAEAYYNLAYVPTMEADVERGKEAFAEALRRYEELGDEEGVALVGMSIGHMGLLRDDPAGSLPALEKALAFFESTGRRFDALDALGMVAAAKLQLGEIEEARTGMISVLDQHVGNRNPSGIIQAMWALCQLALTEGKLERALRIDGAAAAIAESIGGTLPREMTGFEDPRKKLADTLDPATMQVPWEEGRAMSLEEAVEYARGAD